MDNTQIKMGGVQNKPHNYAISVVRLISLVCIIICHIMQYFGTELAWWFNVGVQIFLCILGYLYGQTEKREVTDFYKKRFVKILVPYWLTFICASAVLLLFFRTSFSLVDFLGGLALRKTIAGGAHLWFVPYILLCYVMTPLFHAFRDKYVNTSGSWLLFFIAGVVTISVFFGLFNRYFDPAWMACYFIGYALGANNGFISRKVLILFSGILAVIGNGAQIYIDYIRDVSFDGNLAIVYSYIKNYNHVILGAFLFIILLTIFERTAFSHISRKFLDTSDKYSYETYLVHQFLILGPMSLMRVTPWVSINIGIIIIGIVFLTLLLKRTEQSVLRLL